MADDRAGTDIGQPVHAAGQVGKVGPVDLPSGGHILPRLPLAHILPLQAVLIAAEAAGGDGFPPGQGQAALGGGPQHDAGAGIAIAVLSPGPQLGHIVDAGEQVRDGVAQHLPSVLGDFLTGG